MKFSQHGAVAKQYNIGGRFWKPESGDNRVRILSEFEVYGFHWDNKTKKGGICVNKENGCRFCEAGTKVTPKFLVWVIDRKPGGDGVTVAQFGYSIIKQIGELAKSEDWKFDRLPDYDITIRKKGEGLETEYFVQPTPTRRPLTEEEMGQAKEKMKPLADIIGKMKEKIESGGSSAEEVFVPDNEQNYPGPEDDEERLNEAVDKIPF